MIATKNDLNGNGKQPDKRRGLIGRAVDSVKRSYYGRMGSRMAAMLGSAFDVRADYSAVRSSRYARTRVGLPLGTGAAADYHYRNETDYLRLLEMARDMDRNDTVVGSTVDKAVNNTLHGGLRVDPRTDDEGVNEALAAMWHEWSTRPANCDAAGELSFPDMQELVFRHRLVDGDIVALPLSLDAGGQIQLIEGHRIRNPEGRTRNPDRLVNGVLLEARTRRRLEYWIVDDTGDVRQQETRNVQRVSTYDDQGRRILFHVYNPKRCTQTRGVTALAPIFDVLGMFEDVNFARLVQQQAISSFAWFESREDDFTGGDTATGSQEQVSRDDGGIDVFESIMPGMRIQGAPGVKIEPFNPNVPNPEFFPHVKLILSLIGVNFGMPFVLLMMDASETNFSGWRGALDQAKIGFRRNQRALITQFISPAYELKVDHFARLDPALERAAGASLFNHRVNTPEWPYIEPLKDAQADLIRLRNGLTSPRRLQAERGRDYAEVNQETVDDNGLAIARAKAKAAEINAEFPDEAPVHWREVLNLPAADGVTVSAQAGVGNNAASGFDDDDEGNDNE